MNDPFLPPRHTRRAPHGSAVSTQRARTTRAHPCPFPPRLTPPRPNPLPVLLLQEWARSGGRGLEVEDEAGGERSGGRPAGLACLVG